MPFFFYSRVNKDVTAQKDQDRSDLIEAAQGVALSVDDKLKLENFIQSVEELYHLCNREYEYPAEVLNKRLHNLSVEAINKIASGERYTRKPISELKFLGTFLNHDKKDHNPRLEYIEAGVIAGLAFTLSLLALAAWPVLICAGTATMLTGLCCLLMAAASGFVALSFGEKSHHIYKLDKDKQFDNIQSFFGHDLLDDEPDTVFLGQMPEGL